MENKKEEKKIPKILFISRDDGGCGFYRMTQPASFMKRMGLADTEVVLTEAPPEKLLEQDLVVMQEMGSNVASNIYHFCIDNKIPFVSEIDDFIQHVSPNNVSGYSAWNPSTLYIHRAMQMLRSGVGVTVSTNWLAREYFPYHPNIYVVPNYLNKDMWTNPLSKKKDGKIRIGWAGGNAHADDLKMISEVLNRIVKESKGKVVFETLGMTKNELSGVFPMDEFSETCPSCGYEGEKHHYPGEAMENYPLILASKGWDIALAPVVSNSFGNAKSDLKIKEYAATGIPVIASPVTPYMEASLDGAQISFANTYEEWYNAIKNLIKDEVKCRDMVKKNKEWVDKYWIQDNAEKQFEIYIQLLQNFRNSVK